MIDERWMKGGLNNRENQLMCEIILRGNGT
jgi:hypothetical protein